jgi:S-DNA-T family DNA segregation ATPase FtsK/SpoIIIE
MASQEKRRQSSKKRGPRASAKVSTSTKRQTWINEALSVIAAGASVILLLSFLSVHLRSSLSYELSPALESPMGPFGHVVGTLLSGFLGWCALVPVTWLLWLSWYMWHREDDEELFPEGSRLLVAIGIATLLLFSCGLLSAITEPHIGGKLGAAISAPLVRYLGVPGATIILCGLLLASLAITTGRSISDIIVEGINLTYQTIQRLFKGVFICLSFFSTSLLSTLSAISSALFNGSRRNDEEEQEPLPSPRVRRNAIEEEEEDEIDEEEDNDDELVEDELPPVPSAPAVVQRKGGDSRLPEKEIRKVRKKVVDQIKDKNLFADYVLPELSLLTRSEVTPGAEDDDELRETSRLIESKLRDFAILGRVTQIHPGPVITLFEFEPAPGVKVGKIASLQDDLAMTLRASSIRIIAPIPKRGTVGIEVPNRHRDIVRLRDLLESEAFLKAEALLTVPLGKDTYGEPVVADIATMPHLLIAGTTGTGKSVCINALLVSLLYRASPAELGLILIDPKILELSTYDGIPHLRVPVVTVPRQAKAVLEWAVNEMNRRYRVMQKLGVRNIDSYNKIVSGDDSESNPKQKIDDKDVVHLREEEIIEPGIVDKAPAAPKQEELSFTETLTQLPKIVIVIDELADLMLTVGRDIEELITRLAQKARAAGIHLIVATQRPSVDVVTGLIKANFPARMSFRVATRVDSRTILDSMGADKLLGKGDMLLMFPGGDGLKRAHGAFVSDNEVKKVVDSIKAKSTPQYDERILAMCDKAMEEDRANSSEGGGVAQDEYDDMYDKCVEFVVEKGQASTSMIQRAFRLGYNRAARIIDMMEREGIVGPMDGAKPREVLVQTEVEHQEGVG